MFAAVEDPRAMVHSLPELPTINTEQQRSSTICISHRGFLRALHHYTGEHDTAVSYYDHSTAVAEREEVSYMRSDLLIVCHVGWKLPPQSFYTLNKNNASVEYMTPLCYMTWCMSVI